MKNKNVSNLPQIYDGIIKSVVNNYPILIEKSLRDAYANNCGDPFFRCRENNRNFLFQVGLYNKKEKSNLEMKLVELLDTTFFKKSNNNLIMPSLNHLYTLEKTAYFLDDNEIDKLFKFILYKDSADILKYNQKQIKHLKKIKKIMLELIPYFSELEGKLEPVEIKYIDNDLNVEIEKLTFSQAVTAFADGIDNLDIYKINPSVNCKQVNPYNDDIIVELLEKYNLSQEESIIVKNILKKYDYFAEFEKSIDQVREVLETKFSERPTNMASAYLMICYCNHADTFMKSADFTDEKIRKSNAGNINLSQIIIEYNEMKNNRNSLDDSQKIRFKK